MYRHVHRIVVPLALLSALGACNMPRNRAAEMAAMTPAEAQQEANIATMSMNRQLNGF